MPEQLQQLALESLGSAYNTAFLLASHCALIAALLSLVGLIGHHESSPRSRVASRRTSSLPDRPCAETERGPHGVGSPLRVATRAIQRALGASLS